MPRLRLVVIPEPSDEDNRPVFIRKGSTSGRESAGEEDKVLVCGQCEAVLLTNVLPDLIAGVVFQCPACGSFNETAS
jgi:hypothetical protein